jgi:hypothetical protein
VILVATFADGTEESFDVAPTTKLAKLLQPSGYWMFVTTDGGQVALDVDDVQRTDLGVVHFEDERRRLDAESTIETETRE